MSSDEEEFGTNSGHGSTKRAVKALEDSDEEGGSDNLFQDTDDEGGAEGSDPDAYSKDSLLKAMADLKDYLDPSLKFAESTISSWDKVESQIFTNKMKLQKGGELVQHISEAPAEDLSLEYKAVVSTAAVSACRVHKEANDSKPVQLFFKSEDKGDKSKHLAKFVSSDWVKESLQVLKASSASLVESRNMHVQILRNGMAFIESAFVIKSKKAIATLKEKQNIDWEVLVEKALKLGEEKGFAKLLEATNSTKNHLDLILGKAPKASEASAKAADKTNDQSVAREASLKDVNDVKRESRMSKMRSKFQPVAVAAMPSAPAAPQVAPGASIPRVSRPSASAPHSSSDPWESADAPDATKPLTDVEGPWHNKRNKNFKWPAPSPKQSGSRQGLQRMREQAAASIPESLPDAGGRFTGNERRDHGNSYTGGPARSGSSIERPESTRTSSRDVGENSGALGDSSSNNVNISHDNQTGAYGGNNGYPGFGQAETYQAPPSQQRNKRQQQQEEDGPANYKRARHDDHSFGPPPGAGRGRGRGVSNVPAWMEQNGGPDNQRPPTQDAYAPAGYNQGPSSMPPSNPTGRGGFDRGAPPPGRGSGRGRGVSNLPAWMENNDGNGPSGNNAPPSRAPYDAPPAGYPAGGPPPPRGPPQNYGGPEPASRGGFTGRGRGISNKPAWMDDGGNNAGPSRGPPPPAQYNEAPPPLGGGPPGGFGDQGRMGGGRGRGRGRGVSNLPAWMTESNNYGDSV